MNIVFDLGGVIFRWEPKALIAAHFFGEEERKLAAELIHGHPDWAEMDRGVLTYEDAARRASERTGIDEARIRRFLDGTGEHLIPMEKSVALLREAKSSGSPLYLLSNMHEAAVPHLEKHPFMQLFDGKIYSCRVKQVKPEKEIYRTLLDAFSLEPSETIFIDDTPSNLTVPAAMGIKTVPFTDAALCREALISLGVTL